MRIHVLKAAGDWGPGVHDVPERYALRLLKTGYAETLERSSDEAPGDLETSEHRRGRRRSKGEAT